VSLLNVSPRAVAKILPLLAAEKTSDPNAALRIAVVGGGCSGLSYKIGWDEVKENDLVQDLGDNNLIVVDEKSALYLVGSELDYLDDLNESGFKIANPNAQSSCGCGKSFGV